jgi:hypothetical protein
MKKFITSFAIISVLGLGTVAAQIDSPHNYKRLAVPQKPKAGLTVNQGNFQNNINSVHNYKRQNPQNIASESSLVLNVPVLKAPILNPLLSPNHYKAHFKTLNNTEAYAQSRQRQATKPDSLTR